MNIKINKKKLLFISIVVLQIISIYKFFINTMYIGQFTVLCLLFVVLSNYNNKLIFIDCLLVFTLVILFSYMKEHNMLNIKNKSNETNQSKTTEGFKNTKKIQEFINNRKIKKSDSNLNSFKNTNKKEKFKNTSSSDYYKSFNSPHLKKQYKGSIKTLSKKIPIYIEKIKDIFN